MISINHKCVTMEDFFRKLFILWLMLSSSFLLLFAQGPDTLWTKTYGGALDDYGYSVQQTSDGGYIVCGVNGTTGSEDVYLIKTDAQGNTLWTKNYGGLSNEGGYSVQQTSDGGYIITGYTGSFGSGKDDVYLIKTDSLGDAQWTNTFGDINNDAGYSVQQTIDGGYIIAGFITLEEPDLRLATQTDVYFIKTDSLGDTLWTKIFGKSNDDYSYSAQQTSDGGYIITGFSITLSEDSDIYLIKTDSLGDTLWTDTYSTIDFSYEQGHSVQQTSDGGYIITGFITRQDSADLYLYKTDANGGEEWFVIYGELSGMKEKGYSVQQTSDGGYIVTGMKQNDVYFIKTDSLGDTLWTDTYGGIEDDGSYAISITSDGGYIIAGYTSSFGAGEHDIYLIKTKPILTIVSPEENEVLQGGSNYMIEWCPENSPDSTYQFRLLFSSDGGSTYADTIAHGINGTQHAWEWMVPLINSPNCYIKLELLDESGMVISDCVSENFIVTVTGVTEHGLPSEVFSFGLQSNPIKSRAVFNLHMPGEDVVELRIYDVAGRLLATPIAGHVSAGYYEIFLVAEFNAGVYFYTFTSRWQEKTGKFVLLR